MSYYYWATYVGAPVHLTFNLEVIHVHDVDPLYS